MDEFGYDYMCRTVGESLVKYNIPGDWCAEFDVCDGIYPIIVIPADQIRKNPAMMNLKLKFIMNPNDEYPSCILLTEKKTIAFKVDCMSELKNVLDSM